MTTKNSSCWESNQSKSIPKIEVPSGMEWYRKLVGLLVRYWPFRNSLFACLWWITTELWFEKGTEGYFLRCYTRWLYVRGRCIKIHFLLLSGTKELRQVFADCCSDHSSPPLRRCNELFFPVAENEGRNRCWLTSDGLQWPSQTTRSRSDSLVWCYEYGGTWHR